jgi:hypothetical protein
MPTAPAYDGTRDGFPCPNCNRPLCHGPDFRRVPTCSECLTIPGTIPGQWSGPCSQPYCEHGCGWVLNEQSLCIHNHPECPARKPPNYHNAP